MMTVSSTRKRATNVSLCADLLDEAKALGVVVSRACENGLAAELKTVREARWLAENSAAIESWNDWVETYGLPLAPFRQF